MVKSRRRLFVFAAAASLLSLISVLALLLGLDLYAHHRVERTAGFNWRGYRGPTVGKKQPGELRVAMLGGSTVFGYGVGWNETIPATLEQLLKQRFPQRPVSVVNLGLIAEGAYAFLTNLNDFKDLDFDVVCFYEGYNDLGGDGEPNLRSIRRESLVFRMTGYLPVLPSVLREKIAVIRYGSVEAAYAHTANPDTPVFRPNLIDRTSASTMEAAQKLSEALGRQLDRMSREQPKTGPVGKAGCPYPWAQYCDAILAATDNATARGIGVVVATQPTLKVWKGADRHVLQQQVLREMASRVLSQYPLVRFVDLSATVDTRDVSLAYDGMHLTPPGNRIIAEALLDSVAAVAAARRQP